MDRNALGALLNLNPFNYLASHWSKDLEHQATRVDFLCVLREHLNTNLRDCPALTYAEWAEEALMALKNGWYRESAVADVNFYEERSAHRNLWNKPIPSGQPWLW